VHGHVRPEIADTLATFLEDSDDDVRIVAIEGLAELGDPVRDRILEAFVQADDRPRIRRRILEIFAENGWDVKGFRPTIEAAMPDGFAITGKGVVKRR